LGCAFACGYSYPQLKSVLSLAVTSAAGVLEIQENASELKPYNLGRAAMDGVCAATVGRAGLSGPDDILGGKRGLLSVMTDTPHPEFLSEFGQESFCIEGVYRKLYAACRHCHPAIEAALFLREQNNLQPERIRSIVVYTYKLAIGGHDHTEIRAVSSAKLSTPFSVALSLVKGSAGFSDYSEETVRDQEILALAKKVAVLEDPALTAISPGVRAARVVVTTDDGVWEKQVDYPKGEPENPAGREELLSRMVTLA
jgi:2-methylcitrate dehydratase PrpD